MKRREQALLFLAKAAQDEALLDAVLESASVSDEMFGFHCQQAGEKILKALLSDIGVAVRKTHDLGLLAELLDRSGHAVPEALGELDELAPHGVLYRYEDLGAGERLDRIVVRKKLRQPRSWVETQLREREPS